MSIRLYFSPIIGDGQSPTTAYRAKTFSATQAYSAMIPHNTDGSPKFNWALVIVRASSWTLADADATLVKLFDSADFADTFETWAAVKAFMQSKTVGDIAPARRSALNTRLTNKGLDTSQITLATTWWQVWQGIRKFLNDGVLPTSEMGIA